MQAATAALAEQDRTALAALAEPAALAGRHRAERLI
jgi:hypothetical protein